MRIDVKRADGFNAKIAVFLTNIVGSMWCAYAFGVRALLGLRPALRPGGEGIIAWMPKRSSSQHAYDDTVQILDRLDIHTQGGLKDLADLIDRLEAAVKPQAT